MNEVLAPAGFSVIEKRGQNWVWQRDIDDAVDQVWLYLSRDFTSLWVDLRFWNKITYCTVYPETLGNIYGDGTVSNGLIKLMGIPEPFLRADPDGPARVAKGLRELALPLFDRLHTAEGLMENLAWVERLGWGNSGTRSEYALMLWRAGEQERACRLLDDPPKQVARLEADFLTRMRTLICESTPPEHLQLKGATTPPEPAA